MLVTRLTDSCVDSMTGRGGGATFEGINARCIHPTPQMKERWNVVEIMRVSPFVVAGNV